jgi:Caspase domain
MRKGLVVGINHYSHHSPLHGCANDAHSVNHVLSRNSDGTINFSIKLITVATQLDAISRSELKDHIRSLFEDDGEVALLYFAGHGHLELTGGYLMASDSKRGDEGVALSEVLTYANASKARHRIIVLDSCHSGIAGAASARTQITEIAEGITILTASTADQYATEDRSGGLFTSLFVDALSGSAANLTGDITPGSVYAHIDQSLGPWNQRPVFKTNVKSFVSLRKVAPPIGTADLRRIVDLFPSPGFQFQLNPSYEPELVGRRPGMPDPDPQNVAKFTILQKYNRVNLLIPLDAPHMWHAAMESKACKLTVLGEHYRRLVAQNLI